MGRNYSHLTLDERRRIERWRQANVSASKIAHTLGRHRSTIFRELRRNHFRDTELPDVVGYFAVAAHSDCAKRRLRKRKLIKHPELRRLIVARIKDGWTPEQIAGRMCYENARHRVCQETIYRYVYSKEGMAQELWWYLPTHRKSRNPDAPESASHLNSIAMSVYCSVRTWWRIGRSSGTGKAT